MKEKTLNQKASLADIQKLAFGIVFIGVTVGIGAYVMGQVQSKVSDNTSKQIIGNWLGSLLDMSGWASILVIAAMGGLAIFFILSYIGGKRR